MSESYCLETWQSGLMHCLGKAEDAQVSRRFESFCLRFPSGMEAHATGRMSAFHDGGSVPKPHDYASVRDSFVVPIAPG